MDQVHAIETELETLEELPLDERAEALEEIERRLREALDETPA